jgi:hypothetical protein
MQKGLDFDSYFAAASSNTFALVMNILCRCFSISTLYTMQVFRLPAKISSCFFQCHMSQGSHEWTRESTFPCTMARITGAMSAVRKKTLLCSVSPSHGNPFWPVKALRRHTVWDITLITTIYCMQLVFFGRHPLETELYSTGSHWRSILYSLVCGFLKKQVFGWFSLVEIALHSVSYEK